MYSGEWDKWFGISGYNNPYNFNVIIQSPTYKALRSIGHSVGKKKMQNLRILTEMKNKNKILKSGISKCTPLHKPCLFNIIEDPTEEINLASK